MNKCKIKSLPILMNQSKMRPEFKQRKNQSYSTYFYQEQMYLIKKIYKMISRSQLQQRKNSILIVIQIILAHLVLGGVLNQNPLYNQQTQQQFPNVNQLIQPIFNLFSKMEMIYSNMCNKMLLPSLKNNISIPLQILSKKNLKPVKNQYMKPSLKNMRIVLKDFSSSNYPLSFLLQNAKKKKLKNRLLKFRISKTKMSCCIFWQEINLTAVGTNYLRVITKLLTILKTLKVIFCLYFSFDFRNLNIHFIKEKQKLLNVQGIHLGKMKIDHGKKDCHLEMGENHFILSKGIQPEFQQQLFSLTQQTGKPQNLHILSQIREKIMAMPHIDNQCDYK